ncbi:MAG TPA: VWA domain-containing protein [Bryobacteraceae bacterium]|jgi:VWFA-related protein
MKPLLVLLPMLGWAQNAPPLFTATTNNVVVDVAVTGDQHPVQGLTREDFVLLDNGHAVVIEGIAQEQVPLDVVLICQVPLRGFLARVRTTVPEGGAGGLLPNPSDLVSLPPTFAHGDPQRLMNAAANAVVGMRAGDRVAMVTYGRDPHIALRFTGDRKAVASGIKRLGDPENGDDNIVLTSEGLAIEYAVRLLGDAEKDEAHAPASRRRLIILISSANGSGTHYADEPIIRRLWDRNIVLSAIDAGPPTAATTHVERSTGGESQTILFQRFNPVRIAQATGGNRIVAVDPQDPGDLLTSIRQRYTLWFPQPSDLAPGEARTLKVDLSPAARLRFPDAVVRAREGYVTH